MVGAYNELFAASTKHRLFELKTQIVNKFVYAYPNLQRYVESKSHYKTQGIRIFGLMVRLLEHLQRRPMNVHSINLQALISVRGTRHITMNVQNNDPKIPYN